MKFYYDCIEFWHRMGVQKDDNLIALALKDLSECNKLSIELQPMWKHYQVTADRCLQIIKDKKFDKDRGRNNFLLNSGL